MQRPGFAGMRRGDARSRRRTRNLVLTMAVAGAAGSALGLAVLGLDRALLSPPPWALGTVAHLRVVMGGLVAGLITVAVFSLWMRTVVVGLVSDQFSPRTLASFLEDRFQRRLLATMGGALATVIVLVLGLPAEEAAPAPLLTQVVVVVVALGALGTVLAAIQHAIRTLSLPEIVSSLADQAMAVLDRQPGPQVDHLHAPTAERAHPVLGDGTGWVVDLDTDRMLAAVPPGGTVHLYSRLGEFVTPRSTLALVDLGDAEVGRGVDVDDRADVEEVVDVEAIVGAIALARTRSPDLDLAFAVGQLVDVASHAVHGSTDTATAHEALVHLGAVLERVVEEGLPPRHRADAEGRRLFDQAGWDAADHVQLCAERLRDPAAREPETARHLLQMLGKVRAAALGVDDRAVASEVGRQVDTLLRLIDAHGALPQDRLRLHRVAERVMREGGHALASTRPQSGVGVGVPAETDEPGDAELASPGE